MKRYLFLATIVLLFSCSDTNKDIVIVCSENPSHIEKFAAKELRRYIYSATGYLSEIQEKNIIDFEKNKIYFVLGTKGQDVLSQDFVSGKQDIIDALKNEEYFIHTFSSSKPTVNVIAGGDRQGLLYGTYQMIKAMGVRFYLDGDVIPDERFDISRLEVNETGKPLFDKRGIQPFHDFPEGPDWWTEDDYKAILGQLPKLRMNFFGLHTYPQGHAGPEPTVWIGLEDDFDKNGNVTFSYPSAYNSTVRNAWGYHSKNTSEYNFGADQLFEADTFGAYVQKNYYPFPKNIEQSNEVFNNTAQMLNEAFTYAKFLGIKTCVGTETNLTIPDELKKHLVSKGYEFNKESTIRDLYQGMFSRIKAAYPLDYYWLWTPENWTWAGSPTEHVEEVKNDILLAYQALKDLNSPFKLATCGWVLGPSQDRTMFDNILPKDIPFSCINQNVGKDPVDIQFKDIDQREKWAIPWLEDDPQLTQPQLWVGRIRKDAKDALNYNCNGLLGIHWRTRILGPNVAALADAAWNKPNTTEIKENKKHEIEVLGGNTDESDRTILDKSTKEAYLYSSYRGGMKGFKIALPNGNYKVSMKFAEFYYDKPGIRVFDILMNSKMAFKHVDVAGKVGKDKGYDLSTDVEIKGNFLFIEFKRIKDIPIVSAIEVEGINYNKKINCGGDDYLGYISDLKIYRTSRNLESRDFYLDWAAHHFGENVSETIASIFAGIDGNFPSATFWKTGPGNIKSNKMDWESTREKYQFVDQFAALSNNIKGKGNMERYSYWLNTLCYYREIAKLGCYMGKLEQWMGKFSKSKNEKEKKKLIDEAVKIRKDINGVYANVMKYLLHSVTNSSEMGTITNIEALNFAGNKNPINKYDSILMANSSEKFRDLKKNYSFDTRIIVPVNRTSLQAGEDLNLKVIILSKDKTSKNYLYWRPMGSKSKFKKIELKHINRGVHTVSIPSEKIAGNDFEYYISIRENNGKEKVFPATAPNLCRTVVVF